MAKFEIQCCDFHQPQHWVDYYVERLNRLGITPDRYRIEHRVINHRNTDGKLIFGQYGHVVVLFNEEEDFNAFEESQRG